MHVVAECGTCLPVRGINETNNFNNLLTDTHNNN